MYCIGKKRFSGLILLTFLCLFISLSLSESLSEAVKMLKVEYLVTAINEHKMDQAIIFCRTKLDCDNVEEYLVSLGGGKIREKILQVISVARIRLHYPKV